MNLIFVGNKSIIIIIVGWFDGVGAVGAIICMCAAYTRSAAGPLPDYTRRTVGAVGAVDGAAVCHSVTLPPLHTALVCMVVLVLILAVRARETASVESAICNDPCCKVLQH